MKAPLDGAARDLNARACRREAPPWLPAAFSAWALVVNQEDVCMVARARQPSMRHRAEAHVHRRPTTRRLFPLDCLAYPAPPRPQLGCRRSCTCERAAARGRARHWVSKSGTPWHARCRPLHSQSIGRRSSGVSERECEEESACG